VTAPRAAEAVIRAALQDTRLAEIASRPEWTVRRIVRALEDEGWAITPTDDPARDHPH
jgi:hypothetical protein